MKMKSKQGNNEPTIIAPPLVRSCRFTITLVCLYVSFTYILMTINLPMAIVCLNQLSKRENNVTNGKNYSSSIEVGTSSNSTFDNENQIYLDKPAQGMLLGAYFYGVVSVQLLVGWLCDKYGRNKLQMVAGSTVLVITSFISPVVLQSAGIPYFFALRVVIGIAMSFAFSSMLPMLTNWTTAKEQGLLTSIAFAGVGVANSATYPISGFLCQYSGWRSIFYVAGGCGMLGTLLMLGFVYDSPLNHPRVDAVEKQYLLSFQLKGQSSKKTRIIPWIKIFTSIPVWSVVMTNFFFFAVVKGTVLNLPIFVKEVLNFSITENGIFSAMPAVGALFIHIIAGPAFDYTRSKFPNSVTTVRKIFHVVGTFAPGALMFIASQLTPEYNYYIISLITIAYSLTEFAIMGGYSFVMIDMAPDLVGILQGINKTISLAPGFITPLVIAALTPQGTAEEWSNVFLVFGGLYITACFIFVIFGSAKLQTWAGTTKDENVETKTEC